MEIGTEISQKIRSAIQAKLIEVGAYVDDELPDYIMVMVANKKSQQQMVDDLSLFLGTSTQIFTTWLHTVLSKLQSLTADGQSGNNKEKIQKSQTMDTEAKQSKQKNKRRAETSEVEISPKLDTEHVRTKAASKSHHSKSKLSSMEHSKSEQKSTEKPTASSAEQVTATRQGSSTANTEKSSPAVVEQTESIKSVAKSCDPILPGTQLRIGGQFNAPEEPQVTLAVVQSSPTLAVVTPDHSSSVVHGPPQNVLEEVKHVVTSTEHEILQTTKTGSTTKKSSTVQVTDEPEFSVRADTDEFSEEFNKEVVKTEPVSPTTKITCLTRPVTKVSSIALPLSTGEKKNIPKAVTSPIYRTRPVLSQTKKPVCEPTGTAVENKRKPSSVVGNVIHKYMDEHEEEYDPHYPAVGSVASKIQVTARKSSVPKYLQANRALLLKAVNDAERSVTVKRQSPWSLADTEPLQKVARVKDLALSHRVPFSVTSGQTVRHGVEKKVIVRPLQRRIQCVNVPSDDIRHETVPTGVANTYTTDIPTVRIIGLPVTPKAGISITRCVVPLSDQVKKRSKMELVSKSRRQDMLRSFQYTVENKSALLRMDQEHNEFVADAADVRQVECGDSSSPNSEEGKNHMLTSEIEEEEVISSEKEDQAFLIDMEEEEVINCEKIEQITDIEQDVESGQSEEGSGVKSDTTSEIEFIEDQGNPADVEITEIVEEESESFDLESEGVVVDEYVSEPMPVTQPRPPTNIVHGIHRKKIQVKPDKPLRKPVLASPKFIVTLDGVDSSQFSQSNFSMQQQIPEQVMEVKVSKLQKVSIAAPKIKPFSINLVDSDDEQDEAADVSSPKKARSIERCKFWPACANGSNCPFHHPTMPCKSFPLCKFGDKCLYIHPNCKFDSRCTRKDCPFTHASKRSPVTVVHKVVQVPMPTAVPVRTNSQPVHCRFYPNCHNMSCPFVHPKPCRYGSTCMNKTMCFFYHPAIPAADKLKWSANKSERKFDLGSSGYLPSGLS